MTAPNIRPDFRNALSSDASVEMLEEGDILASVTPTSSALNAAAASLAWEHEKRPGRLGVICYPAVIVRSAPSSVPARSTTEWNAIALSQRDEERKLRRLSFQPRLFHEVTTITRVITTADAHEWVKGSGLIVLSIVTFVIATALQGAPFAISLLAAKKLGVVLAAFGIGAYVVKMVFQEARLRGLMPLQRVLLYTAGFLLTYELWVLFSIVSGQHR